MLNQTPAATPTGYQNDGSDGQKLDTAVAPASSDTAPPSRPDRQATPITSPVGVVSAELVRECYGRGWALFRPETEVSDE